MKLRTHILTDKECDALCDFIADYNVYINNPFIQNLMGRIEMNIDQIVPEVILCLKALKRKKEAKNKIKKTKEIKVIDKEHYYRIIDNLRKIVEDR
jgi:hypothetical protein